MRLAPLVLIAALFATPAAAQVSWSISGPSFTPASPTPSQTVTVQQTVTVDVGSDPATCNYLADNVVFDAPPSAGDYTVSLSNARDNLRSACRAADADDTLQAGDTVTFDVATLTPPGGGASETAQSLTVGVVPPGKARQELAGSFTPSSTADVLTVALDPKVSGCTQTACPLVVEATGANAGLGKGDVTLRYRPSGGTWQSNGIAWPIVTPASYVNNGSLIVPLADMDAYQYGRNVVGLAPNTAYDFEITANGQTATTTLTTAPRPDVAAAIANADSSVTVSTHAELQAAIDDASNRAAGGHVIRLTTAVFDGSASQLTASSNRLVATQGNEIVITADTDTCPLDAVRNALITTGQVQPAENALYDNGDPATGNPLCPIIDAGDAQGTTINIGDADNVIFHGIAFANAYAAVLDWDQPTTNVSVFDTVIVGSKRFDTPNSLDDSSIGVAAGPAVEVSTFVAGIPVESGHSILAGDTVYIAGESDAEYRSSFTVTSVSANQINLQLSDTFPQTSPESFVAYTFSGNEIMHSAGQDGDFACASAEPCELMPSQGTGLYAENNVLVGPFDFGFGAQGGSSRGVTLGNQGEARWNTIAGTTDGMAVGEFGGRLHHNEVLWSADDGVELESTVRNVTADNNIFTNVGRAIAFAECFAGPCVAARNLVWNAQIPIKFKYAPDEPAGFHAINNTFLTSWPEWMDFSAGGENATVANNLFIGNGEAQYFGDRRTFQASAIRGSITFDWNAWANAGEFDAEWRTFDQPAGGTSVVGTSFADWQTKMASLTLADGTVISQSQNSITLESGSGGVLDVTPGDNTYQDPIFVGEASGPASGTGQVVLDLGLGSWLTRRVSADQTATDWHDWFEPTGALVDAGTNLFSQWTGGYAGTAPDIGAVEAGDTLPRYGARGEQTALAVAADALAPNTMTYFSTQNWYEVMHSGPIGDPYDISTYTLLKGGINWVGHGVWCASCGTAGYVFNRGQAEGEGGEDPVADRLRRYDVAANEWIALNTPTNGNHGYAHTALDEAGKRVFSKRAGETPIDVWDAETLAYLGSFAEPNAGFANIWGFTIHPNLGANGRLYAINITGGTNDVYYLDLPASGVPSGSWTTAYSGFGATGNGTFNQGSSMAHYHPTLDAILFGATSEFQNEMFQIDNTGALTQLDDVPKAFRVPGLNGYGGHMIPVPNQPYWEYWAACPSDDHVDNTGPTCRYRLDPAASSGSQWTNVGEMDRTANGDPRNNAIAQRWFTTVIPEHGVVLVVDENPTNMLYSFD